MFLSLTVNFWKSVSDSGARVYENARQGLAFVVVPRHSSLN